MKIALMCPTRNRRNKLLTLIASLITTIKDDGTYLVLGVDEDDPIKKYYDYLQHNVPFIRVVTFKNNGKFLGLSTMWNEMVRQTPDVDIYAMVGDDMTFLTQDWDVEIKKEFENGPQDNVLMVHCNDGMRGKGNKYENVKPFCVNFFVHKKCVDALGYFVEPYIENIHQDTWCQVVYDSLNRVKYRHDILIKHLHVSETKDKVDPITDNLEKLRVGIWDNNDWMVTYRKEIEGDVAKLKALMK
jgi:hypothetical protein